MDAEVQAQEDMTEDVPELESLDNAEGMDPNMLAGMENLLQSLGPQMNLASLAKHLNLEQLLQMSTSSSSMDQNTVHELTSLLASLAGSATSDVKTIMKAAKEGDVQSIIHLVEEEGISVDSEDKDGWRALNFAAQGGHLQAVQYLISKGSDPNYKKADGTTAIHDASYGGFADIVRELLKSEANPNSTDNDEWTPLHYAAAAGKTEVCKILLDAKADPLLQSKDGKSIYKLAYIERQHEVIDLIESIIDTSKDRAELLGMNQARIAELESNISQAQAETKALEEKVAKKKAEKEKLAAKAAAEIAKAEGSDDGNEVETTKDNKTNKKRRDKKKKNKKEEEPQTQTPHKEPAPAKTETPAKKPQPIAILQRRGEEKENNIEQMKDEYLKRMPNLSSRLHLLVSSTIPSAEVNIEFPSKEAIPPVGTPFEVLKGEYRNFAVNVLVLLDIGYRTPFMNMLAYHISTLASSRHPCLSKFIGISLKDPLDATKNLFCPKKTSSSLAVEEDGSLELYESEKNSKDTSILLVYQFAPLSLDSLIQSNTIFSESEIIRVLFYIASALSYLHNRGNVHGYLDSSAIVYDVSRNSKPKLAYFQANQIANVFRRKKKISSPKPFYCAPELLKTSENPSVDIYGLGACALKMALNGPENKANEAQPLVRELISQIQNPELQKIISLTLEHDPTRRPSARELIDMLSTSYKDMIHPTNDNAPSP